VDKRTRTEARFLLRLFAFLPFAATPVTPAADWFTHLGGPKLERIEPESIGRISLTFDRRLQ
jgi:hypothetical protein